jgi:transcriptional regulator with XRE-family HTH domain
MLRNNIVADRIRYQRKEKRMTQKDLATAVNVSPQVISNWERGYTPEIGHDDLLNLALALNVTTDYLLGKVNDPGIITIETVKHYAEEKKNIQLSYAELPPPQLSADELALIEKYRRMKDNEKDTMHKVADTIVPSKDDEQAAASGK